MREPDVCVVKYCGYLEPKTPEEVEFEILGLKLAICEAERKIAQLNQTNHLVKVTLREQENDYHNSKKK